MEAAGEGTDEATEASEPRWLSEGEQRAWRAFVESSGGVIQLLDGLLKRDASITFDDYEVLVQLSEAEDRRMRMTDLSSRLLHSQSRVTQRIDRLECRGWVQREKSHADRRVTYAVLTDAGQEAIEAAAPLHVAHVREHVLDLLSPDEVDVLGALLQRLLVHVRELRGEHPQH